MNSISTWSIDDAAPRTGFPVVTRLDELLDFFSPP
jgi:hypothetical protein